MAKCKYCGKNVPGPGHVMAKHIRVACKGKPKDVYSVDFVSPHNLESVMDSPMPAKSVSNGSAIDLDVGAIESRIMLAEALVVTLKALRTAVVEYQAK